MREIYLLEETEDESWARDAACLDQDPAVFVEPGREAAAVVICRGCPVLDECGSYAEATDQRFGVWGGVARGAAR